VSIAHLEAFLRRRLADPLPGPEAQRRFAPLPHLPGWSPDQQPVNARRAAVLLLFYPSHTGVMIPLTVRDAQLPQHAGQISLPGGAIDPGESNDAAALREAEEEIGVRASDVRIAGVLSSLWIPVSNFVLTPIVGVTDTRPAFQLRLGEVSAVIEAPLDHLRDPARVRWATRTRRGEPIDYPYIAIDDHAIWGATAMVLSEAIALFADEE
jgi:8-oxo-dGTP pyrophosphatase MutT (NUDIX family)